MKYYTYFHTRNDSGVVFYVGKGSGSRFTSNSVRNKHWARVVNKVGFTAHVASFWKTEMEAFEHEKFLISCFKDMGVSLTNSTAGGDGVDSASAKIISSEMKKNAKGLFSRTKEQWSTHSRVSGKAGGKVRAASGELRKLALENCSKGGKTGGKIAAGITNNMRFKCLSCGMVTTPGNLSKHQTSKSHSGKERIS